MGYRRNLTNNMFTIHIGSKGTMVGAMVDAMVDAMVEEPRQ